MDNNRPRRALVLSGGSIKGAFQAGAVCELLRRGFVPDAIYGISVGALNGAFLANSAGEAALSGKPPEWPQIGQALRDFWHDNITEPKKIARPRRGLGLAYDILFSDFEGLVDTKPLREAENGQPSCWRLVPSRPPAWPYGGLPLGIPSDSQPCCA